MAAPDGPVTFRPKNAQARARLEAVAAHRNTTVSKLAAEAVDYFVTHYIERVGAEQFAADLREAAVEREQALARQLEELVRSASGPGLAQSNAVPDSSGSAQKRKR